MFTSDGADTLLVKGGVRLRGEIDVAGALDAALPFLAASLLVADRSVFRQVPDVGDLRALEEGLEDLGATVERRGNTVAVDARALGPRLELGGPELGPAEKRATLALLGPLLARTGEARLVWPCGGDAALDALLAGLVALGAEVVGDAGGVTARGQLRGGRVTVPANDPVATATLMMAATLAAGRTTLENCATEPELEALGQLLNKMGAAVHGAGTALVSVEGKRALFAVEHVLPPDRPEAGVLLVAAAITRGNLLLRQCGPETLTAVLAKLRASGVTVVPEGDGLRVNANVELLPADILTRVYPGFPRQLLGPFLALMTRAQGQSVLTDASEGGFDDGFSEGFAAAPDLVRLGARIAVERAGAGFTAVVQGPCRLKAAEVVPTGPQAAASLVLAALAAEGTTEILRVTELDRGYERLDRKLRAVGAEIRRVRGGSTRPPGGSNETTS